MRRPLRHPLGPRPRGSGWRSAGRQSYLACDGLRSSATPAAGAGGRRRPAAAMLSAWRAVARARVASSPVGPGRWGRARNAAGSRSRPKPTPRRSTARGSAHSLRARTQA
jgi:hypothetical protein